MTKKKVNNRSTKEVPVMNEHAVDSIENELIPVEVPDYLPDEQTEEESPVDVQSEPQPAPKMGRIQKYWIGTMLIFADCAVQDSPEAIFDVLARNFEDTGALSWWLWHIGYGDKTKLLKRKDIVDAVRKVAHLLYRDLKKEIGRPMARF